MFAVVKCGGKQYRVREGQELVLDRVKGEVGDSAAAARGGRPGAAVAPPVGFTVDDEGFDLGARTARVEILEHLRGEKIHIYKYRAKKNSRKKTGHRQAQTRVKVLEV